MEIDQNQIEKGIRGKKKTRVAAETKRRRNEKAIKNRNE